MYNFLSFDIETIVEDKKRVGQFLFGGIYNGKQYEHFIDRVKMKNYITRNCFTGCVWVAHNAEYDINRIFLDDKNIERYYNGGRLVMAKYPTSTGFIYFWDSFNLSFQSLAKIGEIIGVHKKEIAFGDLVTPKYIEYNKRDCAIVWEYMRMLQETITELGGNMKMTIGSMALDLFRRKYMPIEAAYFQLPEHLINTYRQGYYGGRVEVFDFNKYKNVYYYDINSSYPASMLKDFPLLDSWKNKPNLDYEGITEVRIDCPALDYQPLPYRTELGKLLFPCGNWKSWYYNNELRAIQSRFKAVKYKIIRGYHYTKSVPIFSGYVNDLYARRKAAKKDSLKEIFKRLLNSLYGKFAVHSNFEMIKDNKITYYKDNIVSSNVIWSGMISAYSRIALLDLLVKSKSIYTDTDSSISTVKLAIGTGLGKISIKDKYKNFIAHNCKDYEFDGKRRLKGVPLNAVKIDESTFKYSTAIKYHSAKRRKIPLWAWVNVIKRLSNKYDKRFVLPDKTTLPHRIIDGKILKY